MRAWHRVAIICLAALAVLALGVYSARRAIVAHFAEELLSRRGYPDAVLKVVEVTPWNARLTEVAAAGLQAEAVTLHYDPLKVFAGEVSRIEIEAPRLALDLTGPGTAGAIKIPLLPPVRITAGQLEVILSSGRIRLDVEAEIETLPEGRVVGEASFGGKSSLGRLNGKLRLDSDGGLALDLAAGLAAESPIWAGLGLPDPKTGSLDGELSLTAAPGPLDRLPNSPAQWLQLAVASGLAGELHLQLGDLHWPELDKPVALELPLTFRSDTSSLEIALPPKIEPAALPDLNALAGDQAILADLLRSLAGATKLSLSDNAAARPSFRLTPAPEGGGTLSFDGNLGIETADRQRLNVSGHARLALDLALRPGPFRIDGLQTTLQDLTLGGQAVESAGFRGSLWGDDETLAAEGNLEATLRDLRIDSFGFERTRIEGPVVIEAGPEGAAIALSGDGSLSWDGARSDLALALPKTHRLDLTGLRAKSRGGALHYEAEADPGEMTLRIDDPEGPLELQSSFQPVKIAGSWSEAEGLEMKARIPLRRLAIPQLELEAREVLAVETLRPAADTATVAVTVAELRQTGAKPVIAPLMVVGRLDHADSPLTFVAAGSTAAGAKLFELQGRHDLDNGSGRAAVSLTKDFFGSTPWRLRELAPVAPDLTISQGRIMGEAQIAWRGGKLEGSGRLGFSEVALTRPALSLEGLEGELVFAELFPLRSEPQQSLTAKRLDLGETLRDIRARFAVSAQGPEQTLVIDIERADARSILGPLSIIGGRAEPQSGHYRLPLQLADLDLRKLSETAAIEGLAGEGHLAGKVPLEISGQRLRVHDASLANRGAGVLRFRSETAARALAAGGEPVELMLRALEDFRYEELKLSAKTADGEELELFITTLGKNPAVLEGHPFRFNIRLTSNLSQLIRVLQQGRGLSQGVLGKLWRFQP